MHSTHESTPMLASSIASSPAWAGSGSSSASISSSIRPLRTAEAENVGHYQVVQPGRTSVPSVGRPGARPRINDPGNNAVLLTTGKFNTKKMLTLTAPDSSGPWARRPAMIVTGFECYDGFRGGASVSAPQGRPVP